MKDKRSLVAPLYSQWLLIGIFFPLRSLLKLLVYGGLLLIALGGASAHAQTCENIPQPGGESISAQITINGTGIPVTDGMVVPAWTPLRIDSIATATGTCVERTWGNTQPPICETRNIWERHPNHIQVSVEITSETGDMGFIVGYVYPTGPPYQHVINSASSDTTGPNTMYAAWRGVYKFHIYANINYTICNLAPYQTEEKIITVYVGDSDAATNFGETSCPSRVGEPVNVTNGNVYLQQTDYRLPGFGGGLELTRTYNSRMQRAGFFGYGWSSILDESVAEYGPKLLRLNLDDGRAAYFTRSSTTAPYLPVQPGSFRGQVVKNVDNTYTLTFQDGPVHQFNTSGKLVSFTDRNGNAVTLTYTNGFPTTITDAAGRTVTIANDGNGAIASLSDSTGTIASYTHSFWAILTGVTYADGSRFNFSTGFVGNYVVLGSVTDALGNVVESHTYDSQGRALTSEIAGNGTEKYTLNYVSAVETDVYRRA